MLKPMMIKGDKYCQMFVPDGVLNSFSDFILSIENSEIELHNIGKHKL